MSVTHERLVSIGMEAAKEIVGNVANVDVASAANEYGHLSYYFELHVDQNPDRTLATSLRTKLRQRIRDLLIAENDDNYPYVRIIGDTP